MNKLGFERSKDKDCYFITHPTSFSGIKISKEYIKIAFDFAYGMTFGNNGKHRNYRSGGANYRKNGELFCNTFQGKLAEFAVYNSLRKLGFDIKMPDTEMWALGKWDDTDLMINGFKLNIKSAAHFSNLLLLETPDWDQTGLYIPNKDTTGGKYDFFILVRINSDVKNILFSEELYHSNECEKDKLSKLIVDRWWQFDIAGFIEHAVLLKIIEDKQILPKGSFLNGRMKMDADNYYCQSGDMEDFSSIIKKLNYAHII